MAGAAHISDRKKKDFVWFKNKIEDFQLLTKQIPNNFYFSILSFLDNVLFTKLYVKVNFSSLTVSIVMLTRLLSQYFFVQIQLAKISKIFLLGNSFPNSNVYL